MKCSPINALQVECLEPPLHLRRQYLSDRFFFKTIQIKSHPLLPLINSLSELIPSSRYWTHKNPPLLVNSHNKLRTIQVPLVQSNNNPLFEINFYSLIYQPKIIFYFGISKHDPGANVKFNNILAEDWQGWLTIFTDASKLSDDSYVGAAVWIPKFKIILNFKCSSYCSISQGRL